MRRLKDESVAMHQKSKTEFNQAQNDLKRELAQTRKERDSLEVRLKQQLLESQKLEDKVNKNTEKNNLKESMQVQSFREENETLKRQTLELLFRMTNINNVEVSVEKMITFMKSEGR